jgi:hypothetical protein
MRDPFVLASFLAVDTNDAGVNISRLEPDVPPRVVTIARRKGRMLIPAAERFIELARTVCAGLPTFEPTSPVTVG